MRSIWAVAVNTIKQALRLKVAVVFIILLLILLPLLAMSITGDGTLKGRLQTFVSYGMSLTSMLLCLLTIIISIYTLTHDIKYKQIITVLTKPIRRSQLILGKLLGVIIIDIALLFLFSSMIYTLVICTPKFSKASDIEHLHAKNEFFTARASLKPREVDVTKEVLQEYEKLKNARELPQGISYKKIIKRLTRQKKIEKRAVPVGREIEWEFKNVKPLDSEQSLFLSYSYDVSVNPPDLMVYGSWDIGDLRPLKFGGRPKTPVYHYESKNLIRTKYEIQVPANAVAEDGYLAIRFTNVHLNNTVVIFPPENLEMLYKVDTFTANFIKAVVVILFRLIFLATLGLLAASFLSFPVAILFCLMVFFTGTISDFIFESFEYIDKNLSLVYYYTMRWIFYLLPQFDKFNPVELLVSAKLLSWTFLAKVFALMVCLKTSLMLLASLLIFSYREIAKVII